MNILISGSTGFLGSALVPFLKSKGHAIARLTRGQGGAGDKTIHWQPPNGIANVAELEGFDAVIHLAGENIAAGRWTSARKAAIRDSRVQGTHVLCEALARLDRPPKVLASASAIGYYGARGDLVLDETSSPGSGFLAEVCRDWENATEPALAKGIRVVPTRFGVILGSGGGALAKMLFPFKMGVGGVIGNGRQFMSWIALDDTAGAIEHVLNTEALRGPVNLVAPNPVTNHEFTKTLGRVLGRPTVFPMPAFAARLAFGEMADEMLLSSARVVPARLQETKYAFQYPNLEEALCHVTKREGTFHHTRSTSCLA